MHPRHLWKRLAGALVRRGLGATLGALALIASFVLAGTAAGTSSAAAQPAAPQRRRPVGLLRRRHPGRLRQHRLQQGRL
ncbi:hypothetical protein VM98_33140 [Streptomyces rubellomurinus subsp. indigoferus]|nr:hypothetical protein VM98_33140 [Streptomyces rubellomurinus subsp. indigoferus]